MQRAISYGQWGDLQSLVAPKESDNNVESKSQRLIVRFSSPRKESPSSPPLRRAFSPARSLTAIRTMNVTLSAKVVGIDWSDGGGMNLLDIQTKECNADLLAAAGEGLAERLGSPISPNTVVGNVSEYMQER